MANIITVNWIDGETGVVLPNSGHDKAHVVIRHESDKSIQGSATSKRGCSLVAYLCHDDDRTVELGRYGVPRDDFDDAGLVLDAVEKEVARFAPEWFKCTCEDCKVVA